MNGAVRRSRDRRRGQPLAMLGAVLAGWVALRVMLWEPTLAVEMELAAAPIRASDGTFAPVRSAAMEAGEEIPSNPTPLVLSLSKNRSLILDQVARLKKKSSPSTGSGRAVDGEHVGAPFSPPQTREPMIQPRVAAGHQLMMMAALGQLPLPPLLALSPLIAAARGWPDALPPSRARPAMPSRWSGDGWVLLRRGSDGLTTAPSFARYGASQAGAVLRYSLVPASPLRPQAHLRLTRALIGSGEGEAAAGLSLRPPGGVPLRLYGEGRAQRVAGATRLRPAASLVTELPPLALPLGTEAEVYVQGGYVGGKDATAFFDAQISADRKLVARVPAELRVGAGVWAGGQEGATRIDLGPRATLRLRIGEVPSRLALDWRFRVAGNAAPASGPALTLSAGF